MNLNKLPNSYRLFTVSQQVLSGSLHIKNNVQYIVKRQFLAIDVRMMAQKSITSFFKVSPKNNVFKDENIKPKEVELQLNYKKSPPVNKKEKKSSKRERLESSESETDLSESPKIKSEKKQKPKRQRIESSGSESESSKLKESHSPTSEQLSINKQKSLPVKNRTSPVKEEASIKVEKSSNPKTYNSPKSKKIKTKTLSGVNKEDPPKTNPSPKGKSKVKEIMASEEDIQSLKENMKEKLEAKDDKNEAAQKVLESEYNPGKAKYHPIKDACWSATQPVPYLALTQTLEVIETTSARLKIVDTLANFFRSVITLTPEDLLPSVYMCLNKLAPAYHSLELGIAETYLMKAVGQCTGRSLAQVRAAARAAGGLGGAAGAARAAQRTLFAPPPLALRKVFAALKEIANMTGQASVNKKINKIQTLFVACRHSEAKFLIRTLEGKLRIGLAEQSVLQALAVAVALTPPDPEGVKVLDASEGVPPDVFKSRIDEHALLVKTTYCECPNLELVIPALLQHGAAALPRHCPLRAGAPLKPMLAQPARGAAEVFNRFEGSEFTCEWKYDGERAQIHVPSAAGGAAPDLQRAAVFSRNQENNTSKYPDILRRLPTLLKDSVTSCVLDCEAVAYDTLNKQILPFQVLSTRKRKAASEAALTVQVCVFVFDLLLLNGRALVREPLARRRALLREHFREREGAWQFATSRDCCSMEEVQQFLEEAVRGSCEGLMVKTLSGPHAHYDIARRSHNWLKLKKDYLEGAGDSIDVAIIGAYHGRGRRHATFGGFLAAARDADADGYQALCKLGTGFSDEDLRSLTDALQPHVIPAPRSYYSFDAKHAPDVWLDAAAVWEVRCADLSLSSAHRAAAGLVAPGRGVSLRFPRFIRVREDKSPEQATSARQIAQMYLAQDQVKNQPSKPDVNYDDFY